MDKTLRYELKKEKKEERERTKNGVHQNRCEREGRRKDKKTKNEGVRCLIFLFT